MRVVYHSRNQGIKRTVVEACSYAQGEYLVLFASDDLLLPKRFERQIKYFEESPSLQIVYGNGWRVDEKCKRVGLIHSREIEEIFERSKSQILEYLCTHKSPFFLQTALIKRNLFLEIGGFDEDVLADDWALNIKIFQRLVSKGGDFLYVNDEVACYRSHDGSVHKNFPLQSALKIEMIKKYAPKYLRRAALGNMYWQQGKLGISSSFLGLGLKYLFLSQIYNPKPRSFAANIFAVLKSWFWKSICVKLNL
jgi:GT2 family glycosyltransferase